MTRAVIRGINHVTLAIADLDRSVAFYAGALALTLRARWATGAYLEAGSLWLCLSVDANVPGAVRPDYTHVALDVAADDFDHLCGRIRHVAREWKTNASEGASLYFLDPDGHKLELHAGSLASRLAHLRTAPPPDLVIWDGT